VTALTTEFKDWQIAETALWTYYFQFFAALNTKLHAVRIFSLALWAFHDRSPFWNPSILECEPFLNFLK